MLRATAQLLPLALERWMLGVPLAQAPAAALRPLVSLLPAGRALHASPAAGASPGHRPEQQRRQPISAALERLDAVLGDSQLPAEHLAANREAAAELRGFLRDLALSGPPDPYLPAGIRRLVFYRPPPPPQQRQQQRKKKKQGAQSVQQLLELKTTGGDCRRLVAQRIGELLQSMGIRGSFHMDEAGIEPPPSPPGEAPSCERAASRPCVRPARRPAPAPACLLACLLARAAGPVTRCVPGPLCAADPVAAVQAARNKAMAAGITSQSITEEELEEASRPPLV
jgi:hypothetical protein